VGEKTQISATEGSEVSFVGEFGSTVLRKLVLLLLDQWLNCSPGG